MTTRTTTGSITTNLGIYFNSILVPYIPYFILGWKNDLSKSTIINKSENTSSQQSHVPLVRKDMTSDKSNNFPFPRI